MKKSVILVIAVFLSAATVSYSQKASPSTSGASDPSTAQEGKAQSNAPATESKQEGAKKVGASNQSNSEGQQAQKSNPNDGSSRPGGVSNKNANDVGRYSETEDKKSMTHSKEALAARKKNLTESDTTVKKGSGSAAKNTKNHTGKTGNYENQEIKHNQKTEPRP